MPQETVPFDPNPNPNLQPHPNPNPNQETVLFDDSLLYNIQYGDFSASRARVLEAAAGGSHLIRSG